MKIKRFTRHPKINLLHISSLSLFCLITSLILGACSDNTTEPHNHLTGTTIHGLVMVDSDTGVISYANVTLYNAQNNEPITRTFSDSNGHYTFTDMDTGSYYIKVEAQGFYPSPTKDGAPLPFTIGVVDSISQNIYLRPNPSTTNYGAFGGHVHLSDSTILFQNVLVVAESDTFSISGASGTDGYFIFYNLPPDTYTVTAYTSGGMSLSSQQVTVLSHTTTLDALTLHVKMDSSASVDGHVAFVATSTPTFPVDVTIIHPNTLEAVPGMVDYIGDNTSTVSGNYSIDSIPLDTFLVWASYQNDGLVMDPDAIFRSGIPRVYFSATNRDTTIGFKVTGAIHLVRPTNSPDLIYPRDVDTLLPSFTWVKTSAYASAKEYIIEVFDENGRSIWGGFDGDGKIRHPKITQDDSITVVYNFDGSAKEPLKVGKVYRWKVWADDNSDPGVQTLLSSSEDLMGLFKVTPKSTR